MQRLIQLISSLILFFYCVQSMAFINVESIRNTSRLGHQGSLGFKINGAAGNSQTFTSQVTSQWMSKNVDEEYILLGNHSYGESFNEKNANSGQLHFRYSRHWTESIYHEYYTQLEFDEFKALELRKLLGAGLRFPFFEKEKFFFYNGSGFFYEEEEIKNARAQKNLRSNIYFSLSYKINESLNFSMVQYIQVLVNKIADFRLIHDLGFNLKATRSIHVVLQIKHSFDSRPPPTIKNTDFLYLTGLSYNF